MPVQQAELERCLREGLNAEYVEVNDVSGGCGQSFQVVIVSEQFRGKPLLRRHKLVNEVAKDLISQLHAFSQKTLTPEEWAKQSNTV